MDWTQLASLVKFFVRNPSVCSTFPVHTSKKIQSWGFPLLALACMSPIGLLGQSVTTVPVGAVTISIPAAKSATEPSWTLISFPLEETAVSMGKVTSITGGVITDSSQSWTVSSFSAATSPFLIHFTSGAAAGLFVKVTANTANTITVDPRNLSLSALVSANDTFQVIPADTFGSLFGTSSTIFQGGASAASADNILIWSNGAWKTYYYNSSTSKWKSGLADATNDVIMPHSGLFVRRVSTTPLDFTITGTVPVLVGRHEINGGGYALVANRFPVDVTLASLNFQNLPSWQSGTSASNADNIILWDKTLVPAGWKTYYYNSSSALWKSGLASAGGTIIPAGSAIYVKRLSAAAGNVALYSQPLPTSYNP